MTTSQRAAIVAEAMPMLREEAKKRQSRRNLRETDVKGDAREIAAKQVGVSTFTIQNAANIKESDPELFEQMKRGEVTAGRAGRALRDPELREQIRNGKQARAKPSHCPTPRKKLALTLLGKVPYRGMFTQAEVCALESAGYKLAYYVELYCPLDGTIRIAQSSSPANGHALCPLCGKVRLSGSTLGEGFTRRALPIWELMDTPTRRSGRGEQDSPGLTRAVLALLAEGRTQRATAAALGLSMARVEAVARSGRMIEKKSATGPLRARPKSDHAGRLARATFSDVAAYPGSRVRKQVILTSPRRSGGGV